MVLDPDASKFSSEQYVGSDWTDHSGKVIRDGRIGVAKECSSSIDAKGRVSPSNQQMGTNFHIGDLTMNDILLRVRVPSLTPTDLLKPWIKFQPQGQRPLSLFKQVR